MISISIKPGTWVARDSDGSICVAAIEPSESTAGHWYLPVECNRSGKNIVHLPATMFDLTTLPTYHEPDWRKTKFQVQA